jgi:hypothetical protein
MINHAAWLYGTTPMTATIPKQHQSHIAGP